VLIDIILGVCVGCIGFSPILWARRQVRTPGSLFQRHAVAIGLVCIGFSLLLMMLALLMYSRFNLGGFAAFAAALVVGFLASAFGFALWQMKKG
jgi:hypothetical protein